MGASMAISGNQRTLIMSLVCVELGEIPHHSVNAKTIKFGLTMGPSLLIKAVLKKF